MSWANWADELSSGFFRSGSAQLKKILIGSSSDKQKFSSVKLSSAQQKFIKFTTVSNPSVNWWNNKILKYLQSKSSMILNRLDIVRIFEEYLIWT